MTKKQSIIEKVNKLAGRFTEIVLDNHQRPLFLFRCVLIALAAVSAVMTGVNAMTGFSTLMVETGAFAVLCTINVLLTLCGAKGYSAAKWLFKIEIIVLFGYFLVSGEPQGFSPFWAPMLPACGLLLFGLVDGILMNMVMFAVIVFFCWIPAGQAHLFYEYEPQFLLRFPLLFIGYLSIGVLMSVILTSTQKGYYSLSSHDRLTGALNRSGFADVIKGIKVPCATEGFMILDIDHFKRVNDTYGHFVGDEMLRHTMDVISGCCPDCFVCRWGGEEFAVYVRDGACTQKLGEKIVETMDETEFVSKDGIKIHQTISCGGVEAATGKYKIDRLGIEADKRLYESKSTGRNKATYDKMD